MHNIFLRTESRLNALKSRAAGLAFCAAAIALPVTAQAQTPGSIRLSFSGAATATITDGVPSGVTVSVSQADGTPLEGATATLTNVSFTSFQTKNACADGTIIGPASQAGYSNGQGATITYTFTISGIDTALPTFNEVDLGVCGLNAQGAYQSNNQDSRPFTFDVAYGEADATVGNLPQATGDLMHNAHSNGQNYQSIALKNAEEITTTNPICLKVTLTKTIATGCFAGLKDVVIRYNDGTDTPVDPDPEPSDTVKFSPTAYYKIYNYGNHALYMGATSGAELMVMSDEPSNRIWWQFEPTENEGCYYIKNATSGQYIQALKSKGANSYISLGDEKVEYYIGLNTSGATRGGYWMSSTNNAGYNQQSASTLALNKDGSSNHVLTWVADGADKNSYWFFEEATYAYDPTPFTPSNGENLYFIKSVASAKALAETDGERSWQTQAMDKHQQWYFTGVSNRDGGYQIYNAVTRQPIDTLHYVVELAATGYSFRHAYQPATVLTLAGDTAFYFEAARNDFSLHAQIYNMPCGTLAQPRLQSATLKGEGVRTPLIVTNGELTPQGANTVWTKSRPVVVAGSEGTLEFTLSQEPTDDVEGWLYFDWDRDGFFEQTVKLDVARQISQPLTFPVLDENSAARAGQSRMRLRLTTSGLGGAEDDVVGQTIDFILVLTDDHSAFRATARPNDPARGTATIDGTTATAVTKGNSTFVCWKEQNKVVSTDAAYAFTLDHDVDLIAVFSPDPDATTSIGRVTTKGTAADITISVNGNNLTATSTTAVTALHVFTPDGALVATARSGQVSLAGLPGGIYIAKARTADGEAAVKFNY